MVVMIVDDDDDYDEKTFGGTAKDDVAIVRGFYKIIVYILWTAWVL